MRPSSSVDGSALGASASLRRALELALARPQLLALGVSARTLDDLLLNAAAEGHVTGTGGRRTPQSGSGGHEPRSGADDAESLRIEALVDLATGGDAEAFGALYDHYVTGVYRFLYARVASVSLAEDLTSETFFRALRSISVAVRCAASVTDVTCSRTTLPTRSATPANSDGRAFSTLDGLLPGRDVIAQVRRSRFPERLPASLRRPLTRPPSWPSRESIFSRTRCAAS